MLLGQSVASKRILASPSDGFSDCSLNRTKNHLPIRFQDEVDEGVTLLDSHPDWPWECLFRRKGVPP